MKKIKNIKAITIIRDLFKDFLKSAVEIIFGLIVTGIPFMVGYFWISKLPIIPEEFTKGECGTYTLLIALLIVFLLGFVLERKDKKKQLEAERKYIEDTTSKLKKQD